MKVLVCDDSMTSGKLLTAIFESDEEIEVVGHATQGEKAIELVKSLQPDLVTMDIHMPGLNGVETIKRIMAFHPLPIVVISARVSTSELAFQALEQGALAVLEKPVGLNNENFDSVAKNLIDTVKAMSEVPVVKRRWSTSETKVDIGEQATEQRDYELVAIGCSTGGPQALKVILSQIPANFDIPILIVQHMASGFTSGFAHWLGENIPLPVKIAANGDPLRAGMVYVAPDDEHLEVERSTTGLICRLTDEEKYNEFRPSATVMFSSIARVCEKSAIGLILSGMGNDGAEGMLSMRNRGAHTISQDKESCMINGMPEAAMNVGAVKEVIELDKISDRLKSLVEG